MREGLGKTLKVYNMHFKKAFSKKQALTWGLWSGPVRMTCNSKVTSLFTSNFSNPWAQCCQGWDHIIHCNRQDQKSVRALLSLSFCPTIETLPPPWSMNDFFSASGKDEEQERDQQIPLQILWYYQDSIQRNNVSPCLIWAVAMVHRPKS